MSSFRGWGGPSYGRTGGFGGFGWPLTPVVKKLILANVAVFGFILLLQVFSERLAGVFIDWFGLVPHGFLFEFRLWQPATYLFLHGGFGHIFFNMFGLWMFGSILERDWGRRRFLKYYLLTGAGAGLFSVLVTLLGATVFGLAARGPVNPMEIPTIGASGAIYGILLAYGLLYPHQPVYLWFLFPVPARIFVLIYGGLTFFSALQAPGSGVSHVAHLGGMLFGLAYLRGGWLLYRLRNLAADWRRKQVRRQFDVYMRRQEERDQERPRPDRWVN